jgi:hypothetical protein
MNNLLSIKQAAAFLNVSEMSLRRWTDAGKLNYKDADESVAEGIKYLGCGLSRGESIPIVSTDTRSAQLLSGLNDSGFQVDRLKNDGLLWRGWGDDGILTGILMHKLLDHLRQKYRHQAKPLEGIREEDIEDSFDARGNWRGKPGQWGVNPEKHYEQQELMRIIMECIGRRNFSGGGQDDGNGDVWNCFITF